MTLQRLVLDYRTGEVGAGLDAACFYASGVLLRLLRHRPPLLLCPKLRPYSSSGMPAIASGTVHEYPITIISSCMDVTGPVDSAASSTNSSCHSL